MSLKALTTVLFIPLLFNLKAQTVTKPVPLSAADETGVHFTQNLGQWDPVILFRAGLDGGAVYLERTGATFSFYDKKTFRAWHTGALSQAGPSAGNLAMHAYKLKFEDCNPTPAISSSGKGLDVENFYLGKDPSHWKSLVPNFKRVRYSELYKGVDYEALATSRGMKYNFYLQAGANPSVIRLRYEGVKALKLKNGRLQIQLSVNEVIEQKPYAYQIKNGEVIEVVCRYKLEGLVMGFEFPSGYDKNLELVIDPILIFAAQSGSTADNFGMTATYDAQGNLYAGGTVFGNGYPTTIGAYSVSFTGAAGTGITDLAITKYNSSGNSLIYSTYIGGDQAEIVTSLITDNNNNLFLYGATSSSNFPTTAGAYDQSFNGGQPLSFQFNGTSFNLGTDIFVSKLNSSGSALLASTFIGGSGNDGVNHNNYFPATHTVYPCFAPGGWVLVNESPADSLQYNYGDQYRGEIQLDKNGDVYVASSTRSSDFPVTGGFQNALSGKQDAVVFKMNPGLNTMIWSTYLGGSGNDAGYALIVDDSLQTFVTGGTYSSNFPVVAGCYQTTAGGGKADGYLVKINASGNQIKKATYIGTSAYDQSYFVQSDRTGKIYVFGQSLGAIPVSPGIYSNAGSKQFIMRFDNQLTNLNLSTVIGSGQASVDISPSAFSVDKCSGSISLTGWGGNFINCANLNNMPVTPGAFQTTSPNGHDFYLMVLYPNATGLKYGSYFGGASSDEHVDGGTSRINEQGVLYQSVCAGCGGNQDFPVTSGAWPNTPGNPNHSNNCNNGVFKFDYQPQVQAAIVTNTSSGCAPFTVTLSNNSSPGLPYLWNFGGGPNDTTSQVPNPVKTFTAPGTYTVKLTVFETQYCITTVSTQIAIQVFSPPANNFSVNAASCNNTVTTINTSTGNLGANPYTWSFGDGSASSTLSAPPHTYSASGIYTISLVVSDVNGCTAIKTQTVSILLFQPQVAPGSTICSGRSTTLMASGGTSYSWTPSGSLNSAVSGSPVANPTAITVYTVMISSSGFGQNCAQSLTTQVMVNPTPTTGFTFTSNPCGGGVNYFDQSFSNIVSWSWTLAPGVVSNQQNPYHFYTQGGTYTVVLLSTNIYGCQSLADVVLTVAPPPPVAAGGGSNVCIGTAVPLFASGGISYSWSPASSLDMPLSSNPVASPTVNTNYSVVITTTGSAGGENCKFLLTTSVGVSQLSSIPVSAFANPVLIKKGETSTLVYQGSPGALVTWYPLNSTNPATGYTVTAQPGGPSTYTAVAASGACRKDMQVFVDVYNPACLDKDLFIPNTFTPNNDGVNDVLLVRGLKVEEFYFAVYNRWGEMVFETHDRKQGWDGSYNGKPADVGVFGYYLKVTCLGGEEAFLKGNVTLIR
ncbi:MAG TPA: PKD domain-containing protein [Bacteroidia bacterium]|nr:PKD domain-containing protein [Bacteroidia bacterium]